MARIRNAAGLTRRGLVLVAGAIVVAPTGLAQVPVSRRSAHAIGFDGLEGGAIRLADFAGKAVLVVNTASRCGYTPQYRDLQAVWEKYRDKGLVVLGVPSNDFGGQEPGSAEEIKAFCAGDYGITFPMAAKQTVTGNEAHEFYRWAARENAGAVPKWNFHKILIDRRGAFLAAFASPVRPTDARVIAAIEAALAGGT